MKSTRRNAKAPLVLVVDDFRDAREMYAEVLSLAGFRVEEAENGLEAVAKARHALPQAVVMDLSLPVLDGWEATRRIRALPGGRHVRIVAISAHSMDIYIQRARDAGADAFIAKPCLPDHLVDEVRRLIAEELKASG